MSITTRLEPLSIGKGAGRLPTKSNKLSPPCHRFDQTFVESRWTSINRELKSSGLALIATVLVFVLSNPIYTAFYLLTLGSLLCLLLFKKIGSGKYRWSIYVIQILLSWLIANPVMAQATSNTVTNNTNACTSPGLLSVLTNFVSTLFSSITFGGIGGGSLGNLICQVIGFVVVGLLLVFIGVFAVAAYQVSYQQQPVTVVIMPMFGFLIFAATSTVAIGIMLGNGSSIT